MRRLLIPSSAAWAALPLITLAACAPAALTPPPPPPLPTTTGTSTAALVTAAPATPQPTATPVPFIPNVLRLTEPGCCVQPFWSTDSRSVLFIDKPNGADQAGIYGVSIDGGPVKLVGLQVGLPSPDGRYLAFLNDQGQTVIREAASGKDTIIDNDGKKPFFSPTSQRIAWAVGTQIDVVVGTKVDISAADVSGQNARQLTTVYNGGIAGWLDDNHLLIAGRKDAKATTTSLFSLDVTSGAQVDISSEQRIISVIVAPGGQWVMYTVAFDPTSTAEDGMWVISADGQKRYKLDVVGSAHWRDGSHLLVIPLEPGAASHRLWQFDAAAGKAESITDPAITSFRVAVGDWAVSPDGKYVVFVNAVDQALWLMTLPPLAPAP